jgi:hypothetical protein
VSPEAIGEAQRRLRLVTFPTHSPGWYARNARWWLLESKRGYPSAAASRDYYQGLRWAAELARGFGPLPWVELVSLARGRTGDR